MQTGRENMSLFLNYTQQGQGRLMRERTNPLKKEKASISKSIIAKRVGRKHVDLERVVLNQGKKKEVFAALCQQLQLYLFLFAVTVLSEPL